MKHAFNQCCLVLVKLDEHHPLVDCFNKEADGVHASDADKFLRLKFYNGARVHFVQHDQSVDDWNNENQVNNSAESPANKLGYFKMLCFELAPVDAEHREKPCEENVVHQQSNAEGSSSYILDHV